MIRPCLALDAAGLRVAVPLRYVTGAQAVITRVRIALQSIRGFWPDDTTFGLPILRWGDNPATPLVEIEGVVRLALSRVAGVVRVVSVTGSRSGGALTITAHIAVEDDTGEVVEALIGEVDSPNSPGAWWALLSTHPVVP